MRKHFVVPLSGMAFASALVGACGAPPPAPRADQVRLNLAAAPGREDILAGVPRLGVLRATEYTSGGRAFAAEVEELAVEGTSASALTLDLAAQAAPSASTGGGALVVLAPDAPADPSVRSVDADFTDDQAFTRGQVVPRLTASQVSALGIAAILPVYVGYAADETGSIDDGLVFKEARACPAERAGDAFPHNQDCPEVPLGEGFRLGRLDPAREDFDAANDWRLCANDVWGSSQTELPGGILVGPGHQELVAAQVAACGEFPGNYGRTTLVQQGEEIVFTVGGDEDLRGGLDENR
jgi:hypothetical protein